MQRVGLLEQFLNSGVMVGHQYEATERGQAARRVISPLIATF